MLTNFPYSFGIKFSMKMPNKDSNITETCRYTTLWNIRQLSDSRWSGFSALPCRWCKRRSLSFRDNV